MTSKFQQFSTALQTNVIGPAGSAATNSTYWKMSGAITVGLFFWEHMARMRQSNVKPSVAIRTVDTNVRIVFNKIGVTIAHLSSFLHWINLRELEKTLLDLLKPTFDLIASPTDIIKGYWTQIRDYNYSAWKTYIGSFVMLAILGMTYRNRQSLMNMMPVNRFITA